MRARTRRRRLRRAHRRGQRRLTIERHGVFETPVQIVTYHEIPRQA